MVDLNSSTDISQWDTQQLVTFLAAAAEKGAIIYSKPLSAFLKVDCERDLFAHAALILSHYSFEVLSEDAPDGYANIDLLMNQQLWEVKSPNGTTLRSAETAVRKAQRQFKKRLNSPYCPRLIFNARYHALNDSALLAELKKRLEQHGFANALFVSKAGCVEDIALNGKPDVPISRTAGSLIGL